MSSNNPSGSNVPAGGAQAQVQTQTQAQGDQGQNNELPGHGVLEEDDEFEEFEAHDWQDSATSLSHIGSNTTPSGAAGAAGSSMIGERGATGSQTGGADHLWEDNWDDDDVEDDFSLALRAELEKTSHAMST
ncbi:hypothetical protein IE81DRAFT_325630 [Ceraceosorus guamensis]|uniref:26S proteasome complex subunit SEM1 n=1 Tax=Ceraceosorus guamensis TaxID=1522189 RepID=A0A316VTN0_9BASI|nr:hypothetical protein IE81DRAFT_325630 [Ceraceosorus guamensis]PWN40398.1 hypothetical protein IE81DRAFT_325630 [Ceraceosorus guamensis]